MKLRNRQVVLVSIMLFSMFFGAGNLIFPPFLGQNAGDHTVGAFLGFLITAVVLPVLGVVVVAKFDGLDRLASKVGKRFAFVFTILIYLSIGPGLGIPRAASVPFEMAVAPYLPAGAPVKLWMLAYSFVFFLIVLWLCLTPQKLVERVGKFLTPTLLVLIVVFFGFFVYKGETAIAAAQPAYQQSAFMQGFVDGYQTMDTIAALNFGLVIATTLTAFGVKEKKSVVNYTVVCGLIAGSILSVVYMILTYMGMQSSGVYAIGENGAVALRQIVYQVFGAPGAVLLAAIFTLACLTTCVGLINSISLFFSTLYPKLKYRMLVYVITVFSFVVCNQGLNTILSISVPILNAIYPISIVLIVLGLTDGFHRKNRFLYPCVIAGTGVISVIHALRGLIPLGFVDRLCSFVPLYQQGFGWFPVAVVMALVSLIPYKLKSR